MGSGQSLFQHEKVNNTVVSYGQLNQSGILDQYLPDEVVISPMDSCLHFSHC